MAWNLPEEQAVRHKMHIMIIDESELNAPASLPVFGLRSSERLLAKPAAQFEVQGREVQLPRYVFAGPHAFHGIISLHSDDTSAGMYGFVRGATLSQHLLEPALRAAEEVLPRNREKFIDGFPASDGLIKRCYSGVLSAPPKVKPKPFELILETPGSAPRLHQEQALVLALSTVLTRYRELMAYAANI